MRNESPRAARNGGVSLYLPSEEFRIKESEFEMLLLLGTLDLMREHFWLLNSDSCVRRAAQKA